MNRFDEIKMAARIAAERLNPSATEAGIEATASQLIEMVSLVIEAVGKGVAIQGEADIPDEGDETAFTRYLVGEHIIRQSMYVAEQAKAADIHRYGRNCCPDCTVGGNRCPGGCCLLMGSVCRLHG